MSGLINRGTRKKEILYQSLKSNEVSLFGKRQYNKYISKQECESNHS